MSFYLTICSKNTLMCDKSDCRYLIQLPKRISLSERFEVGLVELSYPNSIRTLMTPEEATIIIGYYNNLENLEEQIIILPTKQFSSLQELTQTLNEYISDYTENISVNLDEHELKVKVIAKNAKIKFSSHIKNIFGLRFPEVENETAYSITKGNLNYKRNFLNICVDIVEPQFYCLDWRPLLRRLLYDHTKVLYIQKTFSPIYLPLVKRDFDTIELRISDDDGNAIIFDEGNITLFLHFRELK